MFEGRAERRSGFKQIDQGLGGPRGHPGISDYSFRVTDVISAVGGGGALTEFRCTRARDSLSERRWIE